MERDLYNNELFNQWLNEKNQEIFAKSQHTKLNNEDLTILCLKHFHDFNKNTINEFQKIEKRFEKIESSIDKNFEHLETKLRWGLGILLTPLLGIFLKALFF
jgi:hypothetical protein